jgi:NADH-quinone oxidoreductase subunit J
MEWSREIFGFILIGGLVLASAIAAVRLRNLVHCALWLTVALAGLAVLYLQLGAEFVGLAQILVYVGAVAILIVFAILLTRTRETGPEAVLTSSSWIVGTGIAGLVFGCLAISILASKVPLALPAPPEISTRKIGERLMADYVLPLEVMGLLLTAAMIGAVIIAMAERSRRE